MISNFSTKTDLKTNSTWKVLSIIRQIKLIDENKYIEAILNKNIKAVIVNFHNLAVIIIICLAKKAWIISLLVEKVTISAKYLNFTDIFSK